MRVVATLTTRNNYHEGLSKTLDSLIPQFDTVYLGLPYKNLKGETYEDFSYPGVTVVRIKEDIGPASKLLAALKMEKRDKNTLIVSVDDDHSYNYNLRKTFEKEREKDINNKVDRVFTKAGMYIKYWNFGTLGVNGADINNDYTFDFRDKKLLTTLAGVCGVAYPANIFKKTEDYIDFIKKFKKDEKLFRNDDVLISAYINKLGYKIYKINDKENFGILNKDEKEEKISPSVEEIYNQCYKLKKYFNKDFKYYTITYLELILLMLSILIMVYRKKYLTI